MWCEVNMLPQFLCLFGARVSHKRPDMAASLHSSVAHRGHKLHTAVVSVRQSAQSSVINTCSSLRGSDSWFSFRCFFFLFVCFYDIN